jgi:hypothetical protein
MATNCIIVLDAHLGRIWETSFQVMRCPELLKEIFSSTLEIFFQEDQGPGEGGFDHWEEKNPTD